MNYRALLRLKKNPHYKLSPEQELLLQKLRPVRHKRTIKKHDTSIPNETDNR